MACSGTDCGTDWRILYADLDPEDARQAGQILSQAQIPFEPTPNGTGIRVPAAQLDKARLVTAAKGLKSGRLGFEIFDKPNWVGSEFDEQVNYQRAWKANWSTRSAHWPMSSRRGFTWCCRTIRFFAMQERPAKASVVLKLRHRYAGRRRAGGDSQPGGLGRRRARRRIAWCWSMRPATCRWGQRPPMRCG